MAAKATARKLTIVGPTVADAWALIKQAKKRLRPAKGTGSLQGGVMLLSATSLQEYINGRKNNAELDQPATMIYKRLQKVLGMSEQEFNEQY